MFRLLARLAREARDRDWVRLEMTLNVRDLPSRDVLADGGTFSSGPEMLGWIGYALACEPSVRDVWLGGMGMIDDPAVEREAESFLSLEM